MCITREVGELTKLKCLIIIWSSRTDIHEAVGECLVSHGVYCYIQALTIRRIESNNKRVWSPLGCSRQSFRRALQLNKLPFYFPKMGFLQQFIRTAIHGRTKVWRKCASLLFVGVSKYFPYIFLELIKRVFKLAYDNIEMMIRFMGLSIPLAWQ